MSFSWCLGYLFFTFTSLDIVRTVPPDYCLSPLNRSDCNLAPKTVFSYYKPGSRCERQTWRGCPTANKFDNEKLCSHNCIFRMKNASFDQCNSPLNQSICGEQKVVTTYENGSCILAWWGSCPTYNIFENIHQCEATCNVVTPIPEQASYSQITEPTSIDVDTLNTEHLEELNQLLELLIEEEIKTTTEQNIETKSTTEIVTETDSVTESTTEVVTVTEIVTESETTTNDDYEEVLNP